jgi:putative tryptophan/tyrosine transport system substrate-binding protein
MRRRDFISVLGAVALSSTTTRSRAQQPSKTYLIGVLASAQVPHLVKVLKDGLRKLGYIEGQNLKFEYRFVEAGGTSVNILAAELIKLGPDVIIALGTEEALAAKRATATIPIAIFIADPVGAGIVTNVAHPGGNVTGIMLYGAEFAGKRIEVFKEAVPAIARIAVLGTINPLSQLHWPETQTAAAQLGLEARLFTVQDPVELSAAFESIAQHNVNGVVVLPDLRFISVRQTIVALAAKHRLPALYEDREYVQDGGLISYGPNVAKMVRRSAAFVDKILKGAKPGDLPIEAPTEYELVINLKTAKTLGLTIPEKLLIVADEVIE